VLRLELAYVVNTLNHYYAQQKNNSDKILCSDKHYKDKSIYIKYEIAVLDEAVVIKISL